MAKKVIQKKKAVPKVKKLTAGEFWELKSAGNYVELLNNKVRLYNSLVESYNLKVELAYKSLAGLNDDIKEAEEDYNSVKQGIEDRLKVSLDNKTIDQTNYTIHGGN